MTSALFTDFYELTMAQGYWKKGYLHRSVFDVFYRRQPFGGGYAIMAGVEPLIKALADFRFSEEDIRYLRGLNMFDPAFIDYLAGFRFKGDIWAVPEGELVFPQETLVRVEADLIEAQIVEGIVLNYVNFQTLIATKAARVYRATNYGAIMEFGLRRAQGPDGAMSASRASYIGGAAGTSNTLAGELYGIPVLGTMAHSWVMTFPSELESFDAYAEIYPDKTVYLIDTYDTLQSGIKAAIESGKKLKAQGKRFGVRLDSGDLDYLSREVRKALDAAGLTDAFIVVSNDLDENIIEHLVAGGAPIDQWGVGTRLVTGAEDASFTGVYKLMAIERRNGVLEPTIKFSDTPEKTTTPGAKQVYRLFDKDGSALSDVMALVDEPAPEAGKEITINHFSADYRCTAVTPALVQPLLRQYMKAGKISAELPELREIRAGLKERFGHFDATYLRLLNPHIYKVSITDKLKELKLGFIKKYMKD